MTFVGRQQPASQPASQPALGVSGYFSSKSLNNICNQSSTQCPSIHPLVIFCFFFFLSFNFVK
jgi:hypothetical protein